MNRKIFSCCYRYFNQCDFFFKRIILCHHSLLHSNTMKKLLTILICLPLAAFAQNFHFSGRLGLAGYQGDLKAHSITLSQTQIMGSVGVRYDLSEHLAARSYLTLTSLTADDKKGTASMQQRNLNFRTKLFDWELTAQYNLFSLNDRWWTPYAFAGIGVYHFNPYTKDIAGNKVFLQPLSTEGEGFAQGVNNYKLTGFSIPFGFGVDYALNENMRLGLEFGYRKIFTDYLDDISGNYVEQSALLSARGQTAVDLAWRGYEINGAPYPAAGSSRGNPNEKDGYYYIALTYTVRYFFDKYKQIVGLPGGRKEKRVGCPASRI
jgi:opacity protein-like surface antigen